LHGLDARFTCVVVLQDSLYQLAVCSYVHRASCD